MASLLLGGLKTLGASLLGDLGKSAMETMGNIGKSQIQKIGSKYGQNNNNEGQLERRIKGVESRLRNMEQVHKKMETNIARKKQKLNEFEKPDDDYE